MKMSDTIGNLAKALAAAQAEIKGAKKDSENPFFRSSYADLASVWEACRAPLSKNGIAVSQGASATDGMVIISSLLLHESGEWLSEELTLTPVKHDPQGIGSCITYGKRFLLASMAGVAPVGDDDDGNAASHGDGNSRAAQRTSAKSNAPQGAKETEITQLKVALVSTCKLLNAAGDKPLWGTKRLDEFATQEYGKKADDLELEPLRELLKKLSNKLDAVKKESKEAPNAVTSNVTDRVEAERQAKIVEIQKAAPEAIQEAIERLKFGKPLTELTLDQLVALSEEIIPF